MYKCDYMYFDGTISKNSPERLKLSRKESESVR